MLAVVYLSQDAVYMDLDLVARHGRRHGSVHDQVRERGRAGRQGGQHQVDPGSLDTEGKQGLDGDVDVQGVSVDDGVIWGQRSNIRNGRIISSSG